MTIIAILNHTLNLTQTLILTLTINLYKVLKGVSYSHFPAKIFTKSHRPTAQIPLSQYLPCSNLNPIPIFYCFFVDESQCMKSHFPSQKMGKSQLPFYLFRTLLLAIQRVLYCYRKQPEVPPRCFAESNCKAVPHMQFKHI